MNKININVSCVYCIGDIHGEFSAIKGTIDFYDMKDCLLIFCGDIGLGFENSEYYRQTFSKLENICSENNVYCIFIRGNHDNPSYFDGEKINYPHIKAIKDYTVLNVSDMHNILCIGGAISVDRAYRLEYISRNISKYMKYHSEIKEKDKEMLYKGYWKDEPPVYDENKLSELKDININFVCTHTCPDFCYPTSKNGIEYWCEKDEKLKDDIENERNVMTRIYNYLSDNGHNISKWIYGHYHRHNMETINDITYVLLDMCRYGKLDKYRLI